MAEQVTIKVIEEEGICPSPTVTDPTNPENPTSPGSSNLIVTDNTTEVEKVNRIVVVGATVAQLGTGIAQITVEGPVVPPAAAISGPTEREHGDPNLSVDINYTATKGSKPISAITVDTVAISPITGENQSGNISRPIMQGNDKTFTMTVVAGDRTASASFTLLWKYTNYFGAVTQNQLNSLRFNSINQDLFSTALGLTRQLSRSKAINNNYNCSGGRFIIKLYPAIYGDPTDVRNGSVPFSAYTIENIAIKDKFGNTRNYKLFFTEIQFGSSVNINLIS